MIEPQQSTIRTGATMAGRGLHTGKECRITILPAPPDTGVVFVTDKCDIQASVRNIKDTRRGTNLCSGEAEVHTVEHLLAALAGLGVHNVRVEVDGPEIPAADGSSLPFVELIESAGIEEQEAAAQVMYLRGPAWVANADKYLLAVPSGTLRVNALIAFRHPMIGEQAVSLSIDPEIFKREIAPARTFCTADEIEAILSQGLGQGGSKDNVVIVHEDHYSVPLRFRDEFVRHKVLDLIGDLSLIGRRLCADITAIKSSHTLNTALAERILDVNTV